MLDQALPYASPNGAAPYQKLCQVKSIARNPGQVAWRAWQIIVRDPGEPPSLQAAAQEL